MYMYILVYAYRRIFYSKLLFWSCSFLLSDNTCPKRLLRSPAPLALFPPLPRKTFATYINPTPNDILTPNVYPQLFATTRL